MLEKQVNIINKLGLHARSASKLVSVASKYLSDIEIIYKNKQVSAKSIMNLLMLAAKQGDTIIIRCEGEDEELALDAICELIARKFDEEE